ncbi:unnamed protein product [Brassicogethes aeneus]|uniref:Uncharacterized protein n=1 Tax=Brassicogethes aeneus TaxID=1431903 RepID=A0A9P0B664_BRAAE|nr:unnamed protein product [Brassicogethes aeneus]
MEKRNKKSNEFWRANDRTDSGTHDSNNCYVCVNGCMGDNIKKSRNKILVAVRSAQLPLDYSETVPVPPKYNTFAENPGKANSVFTVSVAANDDHDDPDFEPEPSSSKDPIPVSQELLYKMVAVLNLSRIRATCNFFKTRQQLGFWRESHTLSQTARVFSKTLYGE